MEILPFSTLKLEVTLVVFIGVVVAIGGKSIAQILQLVLPIRCGEAVGCQGAKPFSLICRSSLQFIVVLGIGGN